MTGNSRRFLLRALILAAVVYPGAGQTAEDCWLDVYDKTNFEGSHVRIQGPAELSSLGKLNGQDWGSRIDSLIVGKKAEVLAFRQENFKDDQSGMPYHGDAIKAWREDAKAYSDKEIVFGAGRREHHLGELNFHQNINSLKIKCLP
jgi:hypothetical protein